MTHITDEDLRDEILTIFEEKEQELKSHEEAMAKIESDAMMSFEKRAIAIKNRLVQDVEVSEEKLEETYLVELEKMRKEVVAETEQRVNEYVKSVEEKNR
jgi:hypothetical protein